MLSLDFERAESNYHMEPGHAVTPELEFERQWALQILDLALAEVNGRTPDWIELYNAGASTVNLEGWFLTDDRDNLKKWRFPAVPLAANEYLIIAGPAGDATGVAPDDFRLYTWTGTDPLVSGNPLDERTRLKPMRRRRG